jgi:tRNA(Ile2) C34 agmatinyltransferase TiaS
MKKPKQKPKLPYCHRCNKHVRVNGDRCKLCDRIIWELAATVPGPKSPKLRTTADTYRQLGNGNMQLPETDK